jgi:hypothetical protein
VYDEIYVKHGLKLFHILGEVQSHKIDEDEDVIELKNKVEASNTKI